jgi:hypothetical protein
MFSLGKGAFVKLTNIDYENPQNISAEFGSLEATNFLSKEVLF